MVCNLKSTHYEGETTNDLLFKNIFGHFYVPFGFRHYLGVFVSKVIKHDVYNSPYINYPP